jgi:hypothetical protein
MMGDWVVATTGGQTQVHWAECPWGQLLEQEFLLYCTPSLLWAHEACVILFLWNAG